MESKLVLLGFVAISCIAGVLLEMKENRNGVSVAFDLILGYGIYTVLAYIKIRRFLIISCLSIAGILSILCAFLIMCRRIRNKRHVGHILRRRAAYAASVTQIIMGIGLALIMAVSGVNIFFGSGIMKSGVSAVSQVNVGNQSLADNMETVALLQDDAWKTLTVRERLDVLQTVANIEQRYLGLPNELNVGAANLRDSVLGYYSDTTHEIIIDMDSLLYDSSWEVLDTVCHEAYHSYQYRMVEALSSADKSIKNLKLFRKANSYEGELGNYADGEEDFCSYYYQDYENDARDYAADAVDDFYRRINENFLEKRK